jgi:hypothetical protein
MSAVFKDVQKALADKIVRFLRSRLSLPAKEVRRVGNTITHVAGRYVSLCVVQQKGRGGLILWWGVNGDIHRFNGFNPDNFKQGMEQFLQWFEVERTKPAPEFVSLFTGADDE